MTDNSKRIKGLPIALFPPANMYDLEIVEDNIEITVPIIGEYAKEFPDFETDDKYFTCMSYSDDAVSIDLLSVVGVLFAAYAYPNLESEHFFALTSIVTNFDANTITLRGNILKFIYEGA